MNRADEENPPLAHGGPRSSGIPGPGNGHAQPAPRRVFSRRQVLTAAGVATGLAAGGGLLSASTGGSSTPAATSRSAEAKPGSPVRLASVVTVRDGGLWDVLLPDFTRQTGIPVQLIAQDDVFGPARTGQADIVFCHYGHKEVDRFVLDGFGLWPHTVLFNQLALLGPGHDPAGVEGLRDVGQALGRIAEANAIYEVNNLPELLYLTDIALRAASVAQGSWYRDQGLSAEGAVKHASADGAYTIWGITPFLRLSQSTPLNLKPVVTEDPILQRIMVTIAVNPAKVEGINHLGATALQDFLLSPATQAAIRDFRNPILKQPIFFSAGRDNQSRLLPSIASVASGRSGIGGERGGNRGNKPYSS